MDDKWDVLSKELTADVYRHLFDNQFIVKCKELSQEQVEECIKRYDALTGLSYLALFVTEYLHNMDRMFAAMVKKGIVNLIEAFRSCSNAATVTNSAQYADRPAILKYIGEYVTDLNSREAFYFYRELYKEFGIDGMRLVQPANNYSATNYSFSRKFYEADSSYRKSNLQLLKIRRKFLTEDEHREVLGWLDEYVFQYNAKGYTEFVIMMLADKFIRTLYPHNELLTIYNMIKGLSISAMTEYAQQLKQIYLTEVELQAEKDATTARNEEAKRLANEQLLLKLKEEMSNSYDGTLKSIWGFMDKHKFDWKDTHKHAFSVATEYLERSLIDANFCLITNELGYFLSISSKLVGRGFISFEIFTDYVMRIVELKEAVENDEST